MTKLNRFLKLIGFSTKETAQLKKLGTGITTALVPTTKEIKPIEVFETELIDPTAIVLRENGSFGFFISESKVSLKQTKKILK